MCRFSLIVCTVTRTAELEAFLGSLAAQKQPPAFEVIVVDQNPDDRLAPLLDRCRGRFPVRRLRSETAHVTSSVSAAGRSAWPSF